MSGAELAAPSLRERSSRPSKTIRTAHMGLGPIGLGTAGMVMRRPWSIVVGGADIDPGLQGQDLGSLAGGSPSGIIVTSSLRAIGPAHTADVVVHCAGSHLAEGAVEHILEAISWGASVVSTCEELAYPWVHHPVEAKAIDEAARKAGKTVLATGINPGFAMDAIALYLSSASESARGVRVNRVLDAASRRGPFQAKIGAGITINEFAERKATGRIGHVGLLESVAMIDAALGFGIDTITETLDPVVSDRDLTTDHAYVTKGSVAGIHQVARGLAGTSEVITLTLDAYVGAPDPADTVTLEGQPTVTSVVRGLHGDICTCAIATNAVAALSGLPPGLTTMIDAIPMHLRQH